MLLHSFHGSRLFLASLILALTASPSFAVNTQDMKKLYLKAVSLRTQKKLPQAARAAEKALGMAKRHFGARHKDTAVVMYLLGMIYFEQGEYDEAESIFKKTLAIRTAKLGRNHAETALVLNNLAELYRTTSRYDEAEPMYLRALEILEKKLGEDDALVGNSVSNLGLLYQGMGKYTQADECYRRALEIFEELPIDEFGYLGNVLNNLGELHRVMGKLAEAEPFYRRSLEVNEEQFGKNHSSVGLAVNNLGTLMQSMGQYPKAIAYYRRAVTIQEKQLGRDHPTVATSLNNLALAYAETGQIKLAEPLYRRALRIKEESLGDDHPEVALLLHNIAEGYRSTQKNDHAESFYRRAIAIYQAKLGKDHPDLAMSLGQLASLYMAQGEYGKAEPLFRRSLQIRQATLAKTHPHLAMAQGDMAIVKSFMSKPQEALLYMDQARRTVRRTAASVLPLLSEGEQRQFMQTQFQFRFYVALSLGVHQAERPAAVERSAAWLLNGKAVAEEVVAEGALLRRDSDNPEVGKLAGELADVRQQLARLTITGADKQTTRDRLAVREEELAKELRSASGRTGGESNWVEIAELRKRLPAGSVFVDIARMPLADLNPGGESKPWQGIHYVAWITSANALVRMVDLGLAEPIDAAVTAARKAIEASPNAIRTLGEPSAEESLRGPLNVLAGLVLHPLLPHIDNAGEWIISPDANLWLAPWAALPLPDGVYAVERHALRTVVSGRDLMKDGNSREEKGSAPLVLADPDFDLGREVAKKTTRRARAAGNGTRSASRSLSLGSIRRLPGTAAEAEAVAPRLETWTGMTPRVFTGKDAVEGVLKNAQGPRVLVLSTHGFFLPSPEQDEKGPGPALAAGKPQSAATADNPLLRCGLLLAGCNNPPKAGQPGDDGVLTGLEVVSTDLRGTELVVLSACETGLGEVRNGEGVAGLRQAFQLAGAQAVVATLWQVPDRQSAQLMIQFFDHLATAKDKAEALRSAQQDMIKSRRERQGAAHPYFWAAYTLTGR